MSSGEASAPSGVTACSGSESCRDDGARSSVLLVAGSDALFDHVCDPCELDDKVMEAHGFCQDCGDYLCEECFRCHKKIRSTRGHTLKGKEHMPLVKPDATSRACSDGANRSTSAAKRPAPAVPASHTNAGKDASSVRAKPKTAQKANVTKANSRPTDVRLAETSFQSHGPSYTPSQRSQQSNVPPSRQFSSRSNEQPFPSHGTPGMPWQGSPQPNIPPFGTPQLSFQSFTGYPQGVPIGTIPQGGVVLQQSPTGQASRQSAGFDVFQWTDNCTTSIKKCVCAIIVVAIGIVIVVAVYKGLERNT